jgi:hypothetical protein
MTLPAYWDGVLRPRLGRADESRPAGAGQGERFRLRAIPQARQNKRAARSGSGLVGPQPHWPTAAAAV